MKKSVIGLLLLIILFLFRVSVYSAITVCPEEGTAQVSSEIIQKTISSFDEILKNDMKVTLDDTIRLFICPDRESYSRVLFRDMGFKAGDSAYRAGLTGGMSNSKKRIIAVLAINNSDKSRRLLYKSTAHELFHQIQFQLSGGKRDNEFYWLKEGTADYVGATIAEKTGGQSLEKWKLDQFNTLRKSESRTTAEKIFSVSSAEWTTYLARKYQPYQISDLMVFYLMEKSGKNGFQSIAEFYRRLGNDESPEKAFTESFKIDRKVFINEFNAWYEGFLSETAKIDLICDTGVSPALKNNFEKSVTKVREFCKKNWGNDFRSSMRLFIVADAAGYANKLVSELGMKQQEAESKAKNTSRWYMVDSIIIFNAGVLKNKEQIETAVAETLCLKNIQDAPASDSSAKLQWMVRGFSAIAVSSVTMSTNDERVKYRSMHLDVLAKASVLPDLSRLEKGKEWDEAAKKYKSNELKAVSFTACDYLASTYGEESLLKWFKALDDDEDAVDSFKIAFGKKPKEFYTEFDAYLEKAKAGR
jgi:hypothetical protein